METLESLLEEYRSHLEEKKALAAIGAAGVIAAGGAHFMNKDAAAADATWAGDKDPHKWGEGDWFYEPEAETPSDHEEPEAEKAPTVQSSSYTKEDLDLLSMTLWGEARGEGVEGMKLVANVILNRRAHDTRWGDTIKSVVLQDKHFSAWNPDDENKAKMLKMLQYYDYLKAKPEGSEEWLSRFKNSKEYPEFLVYMKARKVAQQALSGKLRDRTNGALFYHTPDVNPRWSRGQEVVAKVGGHLFFKTDAKA